LNLFAESFKTLAKKFDLEDNTVDLIGHALALHTNDDFLQKPAIETIDRIKLHLESFGRYGNSSFISPKYGIDNFPMTASRICAIAGGVFMLSKDVDKIEFDSKGLVNAIVSDGETYKTHMIVCGPSYVLKTGNENKVKVIGQIIRCICIMDHPIPNTGNVSSVTIILSSRQTTRKSGLEKEIINLLMICYIYQK